MPRNYTENDFTDQNLVDETDDGYKLYQLDSKDDKKPFEYVALNRQEDAIGIWTSNIDALDGLTARQYAVSDVARIFNVLVREDRNQQRIKRAQAERQKELQNKSRQMSFWDDDDDDYSYFSRPQRSYTYGGYSNYQAPKGKTGYVDKLNKSDTLVIHKSDPTTTMLSQIYDGKGWDVLNDTYVDKDEVHQLLQNHKRILMLGHGSPSGLMGGIIGPNEAPYLADKDLFVIWCNADAFFTRYLPEKHGFFCTSNLPSDANEASWVGFHVGQEYMDENITYWCKLCADVAERALDGDPQGAVQYVRDKYWERYGQGYDVNEVSDDRNVKQDIPDEVRITKYNWVRTKVQ